MESPLVRFDDISHKTSARQPIVIIRCDSTEPSHIIEQLSPNSRIVTCGNHKNEVNSCIASYCVNCEKLFSTFQAIVSEMIELMRNGQSLIIRYSDSGWQVIKRICCLLKSNNNLDDNFQLWIIIEETDTFPLDVLRMSFKGKLYHILYSYHRLRHIQCQFEFYAIVVSERPTSLKEHMRKTFAELNSLQSLDLLQTSNSLLYVLGFFHAVIQVG